MKRPLLLTVVVVLIVGGMISVVYFASSRMKTFYMERVGPTEAGEPPTIPEDLDAFIFIPGGDFLMGAPEGEENHNPDEYPAHPMHLNPYFIGKYEVTNYQYDRFVRATGHRMPLHWKGGRYPPLKALHPVVYIAYEDAKAYAAWVGGRLCTEAEWEFAAKGTDGRRWPWGNEWEDDRANVLYQIGETTPVDAYPNGVSPFGVFGMADNVWEWVEGPYTRYPGNTLENWYYEQGYYMLRSGSFRSDFFSSQTTTRNPSFPQFRLDYFGIRVCRDWDGKPRKAGEEVIFPVPEAPEETASSRPVASGGKQGGTS